MGLYLVGHHPIRSRSGHSNGLGLNGSFDFECPRSPRLVPWSAHFYLVTRVSSPELTRIDFPSRIQRQQCLLRVVHFRRPRVALLKESDRGGMIGYRHLGINGARLGPLGETRMEQRQLVDIDPDGLERASNQRIRQRFMADEINIVGVGTGVLDDTR